MFKHNGLSKFLLLRRQFERDFSTTIVRCQTDADVPVDILRSHFITRGRNNSALSGRYSSLEKETKKNDFSNMNEQIRERVSSFRNFGVKTGRTVEVFNSDTATACRRLNTIMNGNQIAQDRRKQRFYMKPGKKAELKRAERHRRDFMKGFKQLIDIVKDAKRKGY
ncbi:hypothetical protein KAFR_0K02010 [Kazachstania africana CBS 2517]|uniref:Ribosomal protein S21 n=1 Tax=Kazachstania africana (strain ATCC 22294 / BCRC 22015 / CBS 2517 / CECT 1963 / NBRC 1671 / NRRL Y-8276) TaxID=1071382 RepID=H2B1Q5_KAZAF|nr:hypothetical protein KAFR_0K02010 [Kazachstania africana CBS 2517]CCF60555.1 hypothetical protein KAFR_0K02010 [Kazachstania africana CBS 2517]